MTREEKILWLAHQTNEQLLQTYDTAKDWYNDADNKVRMYQNLTTISHDSLKEDLILARDEMLRRMK